MCLMKTGKCLIILVLMNNFVLEDWVIELIDFKCRFGNATVVENTERGWRDLIFQRIRSVFGFGMWDFIESMCCRIRFLFSFYMVRSFYWHWIILLWKTKCLLQWFLLLLISGFRNSLVYYRGWSLLVVRLI